MLQMINFSNKCCSFEIYINQSILEKKDNSSHKNIKQHNYFQNWQDFFLLFIYLFVCLFVCLIIGLLEEQISILELFLKDHLTLKYIYIYIYIYIFQLY